MDTAKMMTDASRYRTAIEAMTTEFETEGIKIIIGGDLKIKQLTINNADSLSLKDAINSAILKAQEMQVMKMKEIVDLQSVSQDN